MPRIGSNYFQRQIDCLFLTARHKLNTMQIRSEIVFGWGIPLIIAGTAFKLDRFGSNYDILTPGWCFIDARLPRNDLQLWLWLTGISWDVTAYILVSVFYLMLKCYIRNQVTFVYLKS